ncbi:HDIG domain-containing metalloprotein [Alicyclobacillus pomorum]|uniref:HDIG domain-containing metalloprotein n=1 Tax=Alicyclobacillus pomorum TaxID=204470 RepID=UPI0004158878|nr:HDIG domain-containing metalloprotein [Alicyclobacillus pomorum]
MKTREEALALLHEYTEGESLRRHAYAVEAAMRAYAEKFGEDVEKWGITGLLHDFDYEKYPSLDEHTVVGAKILRERGYPEDVIYAIQAHGHHGPPRNDLMSKALFACDELSGFVMAVAMVKSTRNLADVEVQSVKKKLKSKGFARGVSREDVYQGAKELGVDLDEHIAFVISAVTKVAPQLGLDGSESA